jgi:hypothetical protein
MFPYLAATDVDRGPTAMSVALDVTAWYHPSSGVEISGTPLSLMALARLLERPGATPMVVLRTRGHNGDGRLITELHLTSHPGAVHIEVQGHRLVIGGGAEQLRVLAKNVASFATHRDPGDHAHVEYYETPSDWTPHYLAPGAEPLILKFRHEPG